MANRRKHIIRVKHDHNARLLPEAVTFKFDPEVVEFIEKEQIVLAINNRNESEGRENFSLIVIKRGGHHATQAKGAVDNIRSVAKLVTGIPYTRRKKDADRFDYRRTAYVERNKKPHTHRTATTATKTTPRRKSVTKAIPAAVSVPATGMPTSTFQQHESGLTFETKQGHKVTGLSMQQIKELITAD